VNSKVFDVEYDSLILGHELTILSIENTGIKPFVRVAVKGDYPGVLGRSNNGMVLDLFGSWSIVG
jgi:hypothetical protein